MSLVDQALLILGFSSWKSLWRPGFFDPGRLFGRTGNGKSRAD
jgi:hypothetical protein